MPLSETCHRGDILDTLFRRRGPKLRHDGTSVAAMQQIADWLKKLGMPEYTKRFVENQHNLNYGDTSAAPHGARVFSR